MFRFLLVSAIVAIAQSKVYFHEKFGDAAWSERWTAPTQSDNELGEWKWAAGKYYGDAEDKGIQTGEDARHYRLSTKMDEAFTNTDSEMVVQLSVKHEQNIDCGGAYIKLHSNMDQDTYNGDTPYAVMFGPDICGPSSRRTHVIFNYPPKNDNLLINDEVKVETDELSHLYSLVVKPDGTYEVFIDLKSVRSGNLADDWNFLEAKEIKDPSVSKPVDWVDAKKIADPEDIKPEGYDDVPATIPDPDATIPEDWDEEEDGEYEPPLIPNPDFLGEWKPKMIDNPDYVGEWEHPLIPNPDFKEDPELYLRCKDCTHVGFELWQVKSGTIFDDILVTDSWAEAKEIAEATWSTKVAGEKAMYDEAKAEERAAAEAAAAEMEAEEEEDEEEEEDNDVSDEL